MADSLFEIVHEPIQVETIVNKVKRNEAGAITTFFGTVREWTNGKKTVYLEYIAYIPMAEKMLRKIGEEIESRWPGTKVAITHRIGQLNISDIAVVIAVSSPHRKAAYDANEYAMERIKEMVPIWKKEHWEDGETWVGNQLNTPSYQNGKQHIKEVEL